MLEKHLPNDDQNRHLDVQTWRMLHKIWSNRVLGRRCLKQLLDAIFTQNTSSICVFRVSFLTPRKPFKRTPQNSDTRCVLRWFSILFWPLQKAPGSDPKNGSRADPPRDHPRPQRWPPRDHSRRPQMRPQRPPKVTPNDFKINQTRP